MSQTGWSGLSCCLVLALAPGGPFLDLSYEQALARSREQGSLLIIVATSDQTCPPADELLDWASKQTALAPDAIRIDVDEQAELARSLQVERLPTFIAIKGGVEFDRISGGGYAGWIFRAESACTFIDGLRDPRDRLVDGREVEARARLAKDQLDQGDFPAALASYAWLWAHLRDVEREHGETLTALATQVRALCDADETAREAFVELHRVLVETARSVIRGSQSRPFLGADVVDDVIRRNVRWRLSRLHAAALSAGQPGEAVTIGRLLIDEDPDPDSRLALVRTALDAGLVCPEHSEWLEEADRMGAHNAVAALRAKLAAVPAAESGAAAPAEAR